jgi:hypothetical protein
MTIHAFGFRFRDSHEDAGRGSLLVTCDSQDRYVTSEVHRVIDEVSREHPTVEFDGMIYYGSSETS